MSASVPLPGRQGYETADPFLIREAVSALVEVVLGRRLLVWGGHPAITPMIWAAAERLEIEYSHAVCLFQSRFFEDQYPEDNQRFNNVTYIDAVNDNRNDSLYLMRQRLFSAYEIEAAVFIGGMEGVWDEYEMLLDLESAPKIIAIPSPGGVAREIFRATEGLPGSLEHEIDFSTWFYHLLKISTTDERSNRNRVPGQAR